MIYYAQLKIYYNIIIVYNYKSVNIIIAFCMDNGPFST